MMGKQVGEANKGIATLRARDGEMAVRSEGKKCTIEN